MTHQNPVRYLLLILAACLISLPAAAQENGLCGDSGGTWNGCGSGCGPFTCANPKSDGDIICPSVCVAQCDCPGMQVYDAAKGCIDLADCGGGDTGGETTGEDTGAADTGAADTGAADTGDGGADGIDGGDPTGLCGETGGTWTDCGSGCGPFTCDNPPPNPADPIACPAVCVTMCDCGKDHVWDDQIGCLPIDECFEGGDATGTTDAGDTDDGGGSDVGDATDDGGGDSGDADTDGADTDGADVDGADVDGADVDGADEAATEGDATTDDGAGDADGAGDSDGGDDGATDSGATVGESTGGAADGTAATTGATTGGATDSSDDAGGCTASGSGSAPAAAVVLFLIGGLGVLRQRQRA